MTDSRFDILAGRLTLDVSGFLRGLQTAGQAAERFVGNMSNFAASIKQSTAAVSGLSAAVGQSFQRAKVQLEEFTNDSNMQQWFGVGAAAPGRQLLPMMNHFGAPAMGGISGPLGFLQRLFMAMSPNASIGAAISGTQDLQNLVN